MRRKSANLVIDSRHLKIVAAKRDVLRDSVVFVCLNEAKYGSMDKSSLRKIIQQIDALEPNGVYFSTTKNMSIEFYDKAEFKNRDILVTLKNEDDFHSGLDEIEEMIRKSLPGVKSIDFIHKDMDIERI